jgi:hypothetical protein
MAGFCDFPNDLIDIFMAVGSIQQNYNPQLGFIDAKIMMSTHGIAVSSRGGLPAMVFVK